MKKYLYLFVFALSWLSGCYNVSPNDPTGETRVYKLTDTNTFFSDTLTLYGQYLGSVNDSNYIVFNDTLILSSDECIVWNESKIQFQLPRLQRNSTLYVVINGRKVKYDSSHYYHNIFVLPYPPFETTTISGGTYDMGTVEFDIADEQPIHSVTITKTLLVSTCELSQRLYQTLTDTNPSTILQDDLPVYNLSWLDAVRFCNVLSAADSLVPAYTIIDSSGYVAFDTAANGWRLPTEAEWERFAALSIPNEDTLNKYAWYAFNSGLRPHPCGTKAANKYGLYDVLGNVWEWCWDWYRSDYYSVSPMIDPRGDLTGTEHIYRGGSSYDGKKLVRKECRISTNDKVWVGMRVVRNG
jgi:formylglycine-generating enzyme required for sulfatase activity